jgi:hypothetical protein
VRHGTHSGRSAGAVLIAVPMLLLGLTGCGADTPQPGPDAGTAACSALIGRLPDRVLDRTRTDLAVTGTAGWGDPAIVLRCGVPAPGPSANCVEVNGLEWIFSESDDVFRFVSHDRTPTVEVTIPASVDRTVASGALVDLEPAVAPLPKSTAAPCE